MEVPNQSRNRSGIQRAPLLSLRSRPFPARVRAILETVLGHVSPFFEQGMSEALDALEQNLFRRAEQARNNDEQQRCFESLREVRRVRADLAPALMMLVESALAGLNGAAACVCRRQARPRCACRTVPGRLFRTRGIADPGRGGQPGRGRAPASRSLPSARASRRWPKRRCSNPRICPLVRIASSNACASRPTTLIFPPSIVRFFSAVRTSRCSPGMDRLLDEANRVLIESRVQPDLFVTHAALASDPWRRVRRRKRPERGRRRC
jgi:hypothetical protein